MIPSTSIAGARIRPRGADGVTRLVAAVVLVLGCAVSLGLNLPGQLSFDSIAQLHDGWTGHYNTWHPPVMAWMLGQSLALSGDAGLFVAFDAILFSVSLIACLWLSPRARPAAIGVAVAIVALPQCVLYQGIVWKDVLFADSAIAGFVCLAWAGQCWARRGARLGLIGAALLFLALATLARQNGALALAIGSMTLVFLARANGSGWRAALGMVAASLSLAFAFVYGANAALALRTNGQSGPRAQFELLQLYDLVGAVKARPGLPLDFIRRANPDLEDEIRTEGVDLYTPARADPLAKSADLENEYTDTPPAAVSAQWWGFVRDHPALYLINRARVFEWIFLTPDIAQCLPYYTGVDGLPQYMRDLGLARRSRWQDQALANYAGLFIHTAVFSHAFYAAIAATSLVVLLRRRRPADLAMAGLIAAAFAFAASFFVISLSCDYRYLLFLDLSAVTAVFYLAVSGLSFRPNSAN